MELFFLAVLMITMAAALGSGYPVAFALPGSAIFTIVLAGLTGWLFAGDSSAYFTQDGPVQWLSAGVTNFRGIYWEVERDTLIAIPLFIFMGIMLQRSKIAEDLLVTMAQLFGPIPGGLGISVVFVGALLAATTGIVGATVVAMGLISLPAMLRNGYSRPLATGVISASGTLGQIIPPSIVLIILADQLSSAVDQAGKARETEYKAATGELSMPSEFGVTSTSAGDMFLGALVPGLVLVGLYMAFILGFALLRPKLAPPVSFEGEFDRRFLGKVILTLFPPLALIFMVLGSIITGVATVNQAGAIGAVGAMIMAGYRLREGERGAYIPAALAITAIIGLVTVTASFDTNIRTADTSEEQTGIALAVFFVALLVIAVAWSGWRTFKIEDTLKGVMLETAKTTALVFIILLGAAMLTAAFRAFGGEELVREFLTSLPGGFWTQFVIVMLVIFVLGFFLDFIEIAVVVVPIVAPILLADPEANVTAVWLGVMIGLNIQTSFLTPPFGFALFYLRGVAPPIVKTTEMYKGVIAFISLQLAALSIVGFTPALVNYLPERLKLLSETAPPPRNPQLQLCMEEYVIETLSDPNAPLFGAIDAAEALDLSALPKDLSDDLAKSFKSARDAVAGVEAITAAHAAVEAAAVEFRPVHRATRAVERDIRRHDAEIAKLENELRRTDAAAEKAEIEEELATLRAEKTALENAIPADWDEKSTAFAKLNLAETNARRTYRRAGDQAASGANDVIEVLAALDGYKALGPDLKALPDRLNGLDLEAAQELIKDMRDRVREQPGTSDLAKALRAPRRGFPAIEDARAAVEAALALYDEGLEWREAAAPLVEPLRSYQAALSGTIGLRQLDKLPREQALYVAACRSNHRDISLSF